jgi:hypothetical protein
VIRLAGSVEYKDGHTEDWTAGPAALAEWEIYAMRHGYPVKPGEAPPMLSLLVVAHSALGIAEGFDVWRPTVYGVEADAGALETLPILPEVSLD